MKTRLLPFHLLLLLFFLANISYAQTPVLLMNSNKVDANRYDDYKGSPYLFKDFVPATIIDKDGDPIPVDLLNYNVYTNNIEVRKGNDFIELDAKNYLQIEVPVKGNKTLEKIYTREKIVLQKSIHPSLMNKFSDLLYSGKNIVFYKDIHVALNENKVNTPGGSVTNKRFSEVGKYYLIDINAKEKTPLKLSKKQIIKTLGFKKDFENYFDKNKVDLKSDVDLIQLFTFYDGLVKK